MTFEEAKSKLEKHGQAHVLKFWSTLSRAERAALLAQIETLDFTSIKRMKKILRDKTKAAPRTEPLAPEVVVLSGAERAAAIQAGENALRKGRVAVLLVAGGQGSRLGLAEDAPKGAYAIGPLTGQSLFYFHARKVLALTQRYGVRIRFYIMTSALNDATTKAHFMVNDSFGLNSEDVIFFQQGVWPALDAKGKLILDEPGHIFMNPDGHGGTIAALDKNGWLADMKRHHIKSVFYFQVDNPLVEIADAAFIGLHTKAKADMSLKVCAKRDPKENMGVVVTRDGHTEIVEYTDQELTPEMAERKTADGELYFKYGSPAIHVFSLAFLRKMAKRRMPLHIAHKKIKTCDADGNPVKPTEPNGYKFEKLIFDILPDAGKVVNLVFDRADELSPVKTADGENSPATCQRDMQAKWRRLLAAHGVQVSGGTLEMDPAHAFTFRQ